MGGVGGGGARAGRRGAGDEGTPRQGTGPEERQEYWPSTHVVLRELTRGDGAGRLPGNRSGRPMTVIHASHTKAGPWVLAR